VKMMANDLATSLREVIERELPELQAMRGEEAPTREGWSTKQELGHLIDSATNNHVRFVRAALEPDFHGPNYDQESWVNLHGYNELPWPTLVDFWYRYNMLLAHLVSRLSTEQLGKRCVIGSGPPVTLEFVIDDYILHMQHHLDQILRRDKVTQYPRAATTV